MPTYEYKCKKCNYLHSVQRSIKEKDPGYNCIECNILLDKVFSNFEIIFNGSGFYRTDNKK